MELTLVSSPTMLLRRRSYRVAMSWAVEAFMGAEVAEGWALELETTVVLLAFAEMEEATEVDVWVDVGEIVMFTEAEAEAAATLDADADADEADEAASARAWRRRATRGC